MSYENAPATQLIATHCACCGRPLVDAASVERGVGPECARKYGYSEAQGEPNWDEVQKALDLYADGDQPCFPERDAHKAANVLTHYVAAVPSDSSWPAVAAIDALGFKILARTLAERLGAVVVETWLSRAPSWRSPAPFRTLRSAFQRFGTARMAALNASENGVRLRPGDAGRRLARGGGAMSLHLLRDFAEAYANYVGVGGRGAGGPEAAIELAELAATLLGGGNGYTELEAFRTAQSMLLDGDLAAEDKPMVERLLTNAAIRFARKLALLPPTEKA